MEKKIEDLSELADDIVLSGQDEEALFQVYKIRMQAYRKKRNFLRRSYRAATLFAMIILILSVCFLRTPELEVYASVGNSMVKLSINEKIYLKKQKTPLGYGYIFEISVKKGKRYYTIEGKDNLNLDNIFRDGEEIIWLPDGIYSENFRDENGNVIVIPETNNSILNIEVFNDDGKVIEKVTLILERRGEQCSVELLRYD